MEQNHLSYTLKIKHIYFTFLIKLKTNFGNYWPLFSEKERYKDGESPVKMKNKETYTSFYANHLVSV